MLCDVSVLEDRWGCSRHAATLLLKKLRIPLMHVQKQAFFNMYTLEKVVFFLTRFGGRGFIAPGSETKRQGRYVGGSVPTEISDEDVKEMGSALFIAEFAAQSQRHTKAQALKTYIETLKSTPPAGGKADAG